MKLQQAKWAKFDGKHLIPLTGEQPLQMAHSYGTALPLLLDESTARRFGADLIRFAPGKGVGLHTHVGAHILLVIEGKGTLVYVRHHPGDGMTHERHPMFPGMIYLITSNIPHAIEATTELVIVAVGNDHRPADSDERLDMVTKKSQS